MATSLTEHQIAELEATHAVGFTSQELVSAFQARGVRFSEANLRRYVQLGLVPRSRRVGRKGKNLGSRGLYPVRSVRRINAIKRLMEQRYTLEQIQEQFLAFKSAMDNLEDAVEEVLGLFEQKLDASGVAVLTRKHEWCPEDTSIRRICAVYIGARLCSPQAR